MEFTFKEHQLPEMQLHLLIETFATQQAFLRLFIRFQSQSDEQIDETLDFFNNEFANECCVTRSESPEMQLGILVQAYAAQQALVRTFIKFSCETTEQVGEMLNFYKQNYRQECSVIKEKLFVEFGSVDIEN